MAASRLRSAKKRPPWRKSSSASCGQTSAGSRVASTTLPRRFRRVDTPFALNLPYLPNLESQNTKTTQAHTKKTFHSGVARDKITHGKSRNTAEISPKLGDFK